MVEGGGGGGGGGGGATDVVEAEVVDFGVDTDEVVDLVEGVVAALEVEWLVKIGVVD